MALAFPVLEHAGAKSHPASTFKPEGAEIAQRFFWRNDSLDQIGVNSATGFGEGGHFLGIQENAARNKRWISTWTGLTSAQTSGASGDDFRHLTPRRPDPNVCTTR